MRMVECLLCPDFVCNVKNISTWFNTQRRPFRQFKALYRLPLRTCPGAPWIILYPASSPSFTSNKLLHLAKALPVFILLWLWFLLLRFFFDAQRDFWIFIYLNFFSSHENYQAVLGTLPVSDWGVGRVKQHWGASIK